MVMLRLLDNSHYNKQQNLGQKPTQMRGHSMGKGPTLKSWNQTIVMGYIHATESIIKYNKLCMGQTHVEACGGQAHSYNKKTYF